MGNFHCIPNGCARVVYREYLPSSIRYRYPNEDWVYVDGDDYQIEQEKGRCNTKYHAFGTFYSKNYSAGGCNVTAYWRTAFAIHSSTVDSYEPSFVNGQWGIANKQGYRQPITQIIPDRYNSRYLVDFRGKSFLWRGAAQSCRNSTGYAAGTNLVLTDLVRADGQSDNCGGCKFTITFDGNIVHTETRDDCPEVEKLPCRLSDVTKEIKIEKSPWLQRIEVRNQSIDVIFVSPLEAPLIDVSPLPENCLNIYNTYTLAPPLLSNFVPLPGAINPFQFIAQICSADGCPRPKYVVICDCDDCRECPQGTCAVNCDGHICCYDTETGKAVESIPVSEYCGGIE